jgi:hypothetical protein
MIVWQAVGRSGLCNARAPSRLHVSCGSVEGCEAARSVLMACARWELCVVKCAAGVGPLRVTDVELRRDV